MVEKARRERVGEEPRADADPSAPGADREWEVFVRDDGSDPLRHVGSLTAPDVETAREQSARLFAWYADDLWLCPADEVARFSTHRLASADGDEAADEVEVRTDEGDERIDERTDDGDGAPTDDTDSDAGASDAPLVVDEDDTASANRVRDPDDEPRVTEL